MFRCTVYTIGRSRLRGCAVEGEPGREAYRSLRGMSVACSARVTSFPDIEWPSVAVSDIAQASIPRTITVRDLTLHGSRAIHGDRRRDPCGRRTFLGRTEPLWSSRVPLRFTINATSLYWIREAYEFLLVRVLFVLVWKLYAVLESPLPFYRIADAIIFTYISKSVYLSLHITRSNSLYIFLHIIRTPSIFPINYQYAFFYTYVFVNIALYMDIRDFYLYAVRRFLENIDRHCLESWTSLLFSSLHVPL